MREMTVKQYAEREQVTTRTVRSWIAKGLVQRTKHLKIIVPPDQVSAEVPRGCGWSWFSGVYFIACESFVKIGYAYDVRTRLGSLRVANPFEVKPLGFVQCESAASARELEASLHEIFAELHAAREWFRDDGRIREYAASRPWPASRRKKSGAR